MHREAKHSQEEPTLPQAPPGGWTPAGHRGFSYGDTILKTGPKEWTHSRKIKTKPLMMWTYEPSPLRSNRFIEHFQGGVINNYSEQQSFQHLTTLIVKIFFLISNLNLLSFTLKPLRTCSDGALMKGLSWTGDKAAGDRASPGNTITETSLPTHFWREMVFVPILPTSGQYSQSFTALQQHPQHF